MQNAWKTLSLTLGAMLIGCLVTGVVMSLPGQLQEDGFAQDSVTASVRGQNLSTASDLSASFRSVADAMRPTVVSIHTHATEVARPIGFPRGLEGFFGGPRPQRRERVGLGSGVIVRADGYILTNNHVVADADELQVELSDRRRVAATVIGTDPATDLAVIRIEGNDYPFAKLGDSDSTRVGDWVLAIGSPFGLEQTVTAGIISGKNRNQGIIGGGAEEGFEDFLQTDAAINPGNSGGPLVNLRGEVVGINTAIESRSGGSNGIGFAIPSSMAVPIIESIIESGSVERGFLGAQVSDLTPEMERELSINVDGGAIIQSVLESQPAANGGLQPGDVILRINGKTMKSSSMVRNYVASQRPGSVLQVDLLREGQRRQARVTLGKRSREAMAMFRGRDAGIGAELETLDRRTAEQLGYEGLNTGLVVTSISRGSLAERSGLQVGDVIVAVNGNNADKIDVLAEAIRKTATEGRASQLVVLSGNERRLIVIRP